LEASFKVGQGSTSGCRAIEEEEEEVQEMCWFLTHGHGDNLRRVLQNKVTKMDIELNGVNVRT
jgi:hypothetical protein